MHGGGKIQIVISIHALRKESDDNSTNRLMVEIISIHALRKESDCASKKLRHG